MRTFDNPSCSRTLPLLVVVPTLRPSLLVGRGLSSVELEEVGFSCLVRSPVEPEYCPSRLSSMVNWLSRTLGWYFQYLLDLLQWAARDRSTTPEPFPSTQRARINLSPIR